MTEEVEKKFISTSFGDIAYLESGSENTSRPPVLLIHGIPTSSYLWRNVLRFLKNDFHCFAPDLMGLGDTNVDPDSTKFHMDSQAEMLEEFMAELGHKKFAVVCHDQGGAAAQILAANRPGLFTCFILTDCVCYDNWPVPTIAKLQTFSRIPVIPEVLIQSGLFKFKEGNSLTSSFRRGLYDPERISNDTISEYLKPIHGDAKSRKRMLQFILAGNPSFTLRAVPGLKKFDKPTAILWAGDDHYISPSWGRKLHEDIPGSKKFEIIPFCGHFWQEERPSEFASHIGKFLASHNKIDKKKKKGKPS